MEVPARYGFDSTHYERFDEGRELFGVWGTVDAASGNMNSLGFIAKDGNC